jgi:prephenate dehydrogenase
LADVAIIGLGPVALSLAQATTRAFSGAAVIGFDPDKSRVRRAREAGMFDSVTDRLSMALADVSLVVVDTPLRDAPAALESIGRLAPASCIVTDTCSLKRPVLDWAAKFLPPSMGFVGGHLIVEQSADAYMVSTAGATYCLVCDASTSSEAVGVVTALASAAGAKPLFIDADEHDSFVLASCLLPKIANGAAIDAVIRSSAWRDIQNLRSDLFGLTVPSPLAADSGDVSLSDIASLGVDNVGPLLFWIERLESELKSLRESIVRGVAAGEMIDFDALTRERLDLLIQRPSFQPKIERSGIGSLVLGDWLTNRAKQRRQT